MNSGISRIEKKKIKLVHEIFEWLDFKYPDEYMIINPTDENKT